MNADIENVIELSVGKVIASNLYISSLLTTIIAILAVLGLRFFLIRLLKGKKEILDKEQRRWINRVNNSASILALVCLVFIWAPQLHTFALSLTAVAVAVVLTTKELLMCLTGGFLRATTKPFDIGDWITVDGQTGEVMRITTLTTSIQEVVTADKTYQFSGRTIQIPNSKYLSSSIENSNFIKHYIYYDLPVTLQYADMDPEQLMAELQKITEKYYAQFRDGAIQYNKKIEKKAAVDFSDPDPQFSLNTTELGHNTYKVRLFLPTSQAVKIGSDITRDFLSYAYKLKKQVPIQPLNSEGNTE